MNNIRCRDRGRTRSLDGNSLTQPEQKYQSLLGNRRLDQTTERDRFDQHLSSDPKLLLLAKQSVEISATVGVLAYRALLDISYRFRCQHGLALLNDLEPCSTCETPRKCFCYGRLPLVKVDRRTKRKTIVTSTPKCPRCGWEYTIRRGKPCRCSACGHQWREGQARAPG